VQWLTDGRLVMIVHTDVLVQGVDDGPQQKAPADAEGSPSRRIEQNGVALGAPDTTAVSLPRKLPPFTTAPRVNTYSNGDSDLLMTSSDNVSFAVHASRLRGVSSVMLITGDRNPS
jgi:hypothetical protein